MSIRVSDLTKYYGDQAAVNNISFELKKGEIVGFLGPNGAGKSTTMKMITGYLPISSGSVWVAGLNVNDEPQNVRKKIGYLPESNPLYFDMYVREYLMFAAGIHQLGKSAKDQVENVIIKTGLLKEAHKKIGLLSKGYKQRVGLAQAILHNPDVLILDEPTTGLDPNQIIEIRALIKELGKEKTVLLSTHIMQEVQAICNRVLIINNGKIVADNTPEQLITKDTQHQLTITLNTSIEPKIWKQFNQIDNAIELGNNRYQLTTQHPDKLRKDLMKWALEKDYSILSLQSEKQTLEEVFRNLTA